MKKIIIKFCVLIVLGIGFMLFYAHTHGSVTSGWGLLASFLLGYFVGWIIGEIFKLEAKLNTIKNELKFKVEMLDSMKIHGNTEFVAEYNCLVRRAVEIVDPWFYDRKKK